MRPAMLVGCRFHVTWIREPPVATGVSLALT
jgi:hypothetical protein